MHLMNSILTHTGGSVGWASGCHAGGLSSTPTPLPLPFSSRKCQTALTDVTLSNSRWFYSSIGNHLGVKGFTYFSQHLTLEFVVSVGLFFTRKNAALTSWLNVHINFCLLYVWAICLVSLRTRQYTDHIPFSLCRLVFKLWLNRVRPLVNENVNYFVFFGQFIAQCGLWVVLDQWQMQA